MHGAELGAGVGASAKHSITIAINNRVAARSLALGLREPMAARRPLGVSEWGDSSPRDDVASLSKKANKTQEAGPCWGGT